MGLAGFVVLDWARRGNRGGGDVGVVICCCLLGGGEEVGGSRGCGEEGGFLVWNFCFWDRDAARDS